MPVILIALSIDSQTQAVSSNRARKQHKVKRNEFLEVEISKKKTKENRRERVLRATMKKLVEQRAGLCWLGKMLGLSPSWLSDTHAPMLSFHKYSPIQGSSRNFTKAKLQPALHRERPAISAFNGTLKRDFLISPHCARSLFTLRRYVRTKGGKRRREASPVLKR